ncbi:MAG: choice-of-anchor R domain-containing protein [Anaerolineae bacterium]|nr:choice-of-anchor R domain-containing protein [Anaerolineae bacterium]MDQ7037043.1 choice-of-anchor R domain-containing protein [Anaerolineae bacterium]
MNSRRLTTVMLIFSILVLLVATVSADIVFSNFPDNGVYGGWCSQVALGFRIPEEDDYRLNSVQISLRHILDDSVTLQLFSDRNGLPNQALQTIDTRQVNKDNAYTFDANSGIRLNAGETYWLYIDASACNVTWDDIGESNPSGQFSIVGYMRYTNEWVDASDDGRLMLAVMIDAVVAGGS